MWLPRRVEILIEKIESSLGEIEYALKEKINAVPVDDKATHDKHREAAGVVATAIETTANAQSSYEQPQRDKEYRVQVFIVILTFLAAAGAIAAAFASWLTLPSIKKSADAAYTAAQATQDQADATYAAIDLQDIQMKQNRIDNARAQWMQERTLEQSAEDAKNAVAESERILNVQTRPWLGIEVTEAAGQTLDDDPSTRPPNESEANRLKYKLRRVTFQYTIHNYGGGPALRQSAGGFDGWNTSDMSSMVSPPSLAVACQNETESLVNRLSRGVPIFPGEAVFSRAEPIPSLSYKYGTEVMSTIGCVAYQGQSATDPSGVVDPKTIHHSAVRVACKVGENRADKKPPEVTCSVQSIGAD